jgi:hypothetical protein
MEAHTFTKPKKMKKIKVCKNDGGNCVLGHKRNVGGGIHATRENNIGSAQRNT